VTLTIRHVANLKFLVGARSNFGGARFFIYSDDKGAGRKISRGWGNGKDDRKIAKKTKK